MKLSDFTEVERIEKGWSKDKKYRVTREDRTRYFLRISDVDTVDQRKREFERMKQLTELHVPMCEPIEIKVCEDGVYFLQSWINGEDAIEEIPLLPNTDQYKYGIKAGEILKKIHSIQAPTELETWEVRFNRKLDRKIKGYQECTLQYEGGDAFLKYIAANRSLLKGRPQCYQHGDYHIGNMMLEHGELKIIDFDRDDYGDPWEEFNRIVWCSQKSPKFASGMVNGYFDGAPPMEFWNLLALYIASNTLSSLYWAVPFGYKEVATMQEQAKEVLQWYDGMKNPVPTWYRV